MGDNGLAIAVIVGFLLLLFGGMLLSGAPILK